MIDRSDTVISFDRQNMYSGAMITLRKWIKRLASIGKKVGLPIESPRDHQLNDDHGSYSAASSSEAPSIAENDSAYSSDKPIISPDQDRFDRWPFANRIAETLVTRSDPTSLVIALYGPWGDGKTSTLAMMEHALAEKQRVVCVRFNPWNFQSHDLLLRAFFTTLADAVGRALPSGRERIGQLLDRYGALLSIANVGLAGGAVQISAGDAVRQAGKTMSTVELSELKERIEEILREAKKRVVVLIDDIDRLDREETHAVFKLVKLSADFEYTSYVLAFDDEVVAASLGERYGAGGAQAGRRFLEKIIQVPLHLPGVERALLRQVAFEGIDEAIRMSGVTLSQEQVDVFSRHFVDSIEPQISTPRQAKLYSNALLFALPILKGEVNPVDQMLIEGVRLFFPKLYALIRDNPSTFLQVNADRDDNADSEHLRQIVVDALSGVGDRDRNNVTSRLLVHLFPQTSHAFGGARYGSDWRGTWEKNQRVCTEDYIQRYFGYGVPSRDVSDQVVLRLIAQASDTESADLDENLGNFMPPALSKLVDKLRRHEDTVEMSAGARIALAIAKVAHRLPRERGMLMEDMSYRQAAILIARLIRRQDSTQRVNFAVDTIEQTDSLAFGFECLRWLRKGEKESEEDRILSKENETKVAQVLVARIEKSAQEAPLYRTHGRDAGAFLWLWNRYGNTGDLSKYLRSRIDSGIAEIDEFIDVYVGLAWGMESGIPHRSDLDRDQYNAIAQIIDPGYIVEKLRERHKDALDDTEFHQSEGVPLPLKFARQFAFVHRVASGEKEPKNTENSE